MNAPLSTKDVWDRHLEALCSKDVDMMLEAYDETSTLRIVNQAYGAPGQVMNGLAAIRNGLSGLLELLVDIGTFSVQMEEVEERAVGGNGLVFASWVCPSSGFKDATETILVGRSHKILRHNIVMWREGLGFAPGKPELTAL